MKYLLFAGNTYYASGGWNDFKGTYTSERDALIALARLDFDWYHIVDMETMKISLGEGWIQS